MWCKRGEVLVAWRCVVQGHHLKLLWPNAAEQEGIEPRPQKRWDRFLGEFGSVAFAPLYSTFLHQEDGVSCHPTCLLMLHFLLSRHVVNGSIQLPQDKLWLLHEITQAALHYRDSAHAPPIETTPSWALARMYARPYCSPRRSSCFFCDDTTHITCPRDLWGPMRTYGVLCGPMGAYGDLGAPMGAFGDLWGPLEAYGDLLGPMGTYGDLWGPMGAYGVHGDLWGPMGA